MFLGLSTISIIKRTEQKKKNVLALELSTRVIELSSRDTDHSARDIELSARDIELSDRDIELNAKDIDHSARDTGGCFRVKDCCIKNVLHKLCKKVLNFRIARPSY